MVKEVIINDFQKVRFWIGELPFECICSDLSDKELKSYRKYAVELKNGIKCNNNYALLGGLFKQDTSRKNVDVIIKSSNSFQNEYHSDYSALNDTPIAGINPEIIDWVNNFEICKEVSGELIINCAAFAPVGSSRSCFDLAYKLLINIIDCQNNKLDFDVFTERCRNILNS